MTLLQFPHYHSKLSKQEHSGNMQKETHAAKYQRNGAIKHSNKPLHRPINYYSNKTSFLNSGVTREGPHELISTLKIRCQYRDDPEGPNSRDRSSWATKGPAKFDTLQTVTVFAAFGRSTG